MSANHYTVVRQLMALTGPKVGRRDVNAMRVIEKAANTIVELAQDRRRLSEMTKVGRRLTLSQSVTLQNLRRDKAQFQRGKLPRVGYTVSAGPPLAMATTLADLIDGPCDLYRTRTGGVRVVRADENVKTGEYLGRFDDGATIEDIKDAIE
jgi:hypothetical protein